MEPETSLDIAALTVRMARGEETSFHEFHARYFNRLLRYLLVVARGREEIAREALQLTFVRVARHVRRFESEIVFWNWLTVLARSSLADESRKRGRYQNLLARFFHFKTADPDPNHIDSEVRFAELLEAELTELPSEDRELLEQKYFERQLVRALAEERRMTEKALESHLLRIRRKLKAAVLEKLRNETND